MNRKALFEIVTEAGRLRKAMGPMNAVKVLERAKSHHGPNGFRNPYVSSTPGFGGVIKWQLGLGPEEHPVVPDSAIPPYVPQTVSPDYERLHSPHSAKAQVTWIGHSSFLIQMHGLNILTDPVWSERASPVSFIGPKRLMPPGIPVERLPAIDLVLISHNHYDHLDEPTVRYLGNRPKYLVPLGVKSWLARRAITTADERDWWQMASFRDLRLHCVPSQHFSGRGLTDHNETLWCGWIIQSGAFHVHFVGDTGYSPDFKVINETFGPPDLAFIPIGAYRPRWFMNPVHVDPFQAVQIHKDLQSRRSIGMHWGTFRLSDEPLGAPPVELRLTAEKAGLATEAFTVMQCGETRLF